MFQYFETIMIPKLYSKYTILQVIKGTRLPMIRVLHQMHLTKPVHSIFHGDDAFNCSQKWAKTPNR